MCIRAAAPFYKATRRRRPPRNWPRSLLAWHFLAERRMEAAAIGEVPVLRISLGKTLSYLEALWQVLGAAEGILSKTQITALISKVTQQIAEACLPKRRERNCPRKVRQPIQGSPRLTKTDSVQRARCY
jgi:hypothetical protein